MLQTSSKFWVSLSVLSYQLSLLNRCRQKEDLDFPRFLQENLLQQKRWRFFFRIELQWRNEIKETMTGLTQVLDKNTTDELFKPVQRETLGVVGNLQFRFPIKPWLVRDGFLREFLCGSCRLQHRTKVEKGCQAKRRSGQFLQRN